jgi:TolB-like protein/Tfp pilus assembly protein PilF
MITGQKPFHKATATDTMVAILQNPPPPLRECGRDWPVELDPVIMRCLEKDPGARYGSAAEVVQALREIRDAARSDTWKTPASQAATTGTVLVTPTGMHVYQASVAVLPFVNMSADKENEYFSDGLAEELINVLSRIEGLHVASRTSAFSFKGKNEDVRKIGTQLNVATVLEGSVRKAGNRVRISVQLVNVADGYQLWAETYNRQLEDIFVIQDEIAQNIAKALQVILTEKDRRASDKVHPADVQAYDYYLRGMQFFHQFRRKGFDFAREMFTRAIAIDPKYARAYAGLADCHSVLYTNWDKNPGHLEEADAASRKALELGPELAEAHAARGLAVMLKENYEEARKEFEAAIRLNPNLFEAHYFYARGCLAEGKLPEAAALFAKAALLRPEDYQAPLVGAGVLMGLGRQAEAESAFRHGLQAAEKRLEQHPDDARAYCLGALAWVQLGKPERSLEWAKRALQIDSEEPMTYYNVACVYALVKKVEEAIDCLENAVKYGYRHKAWIAHDSDLNACRDHPRFQELLTKI